MNSVLPLFHSFYLHSVFFFTTFLHVDEENVSVRLVCDDTKYAGRLRRSLQQRFPEWEPDPDRSNRQWYIKPWDCLMEKLFDTFIQWIHRQGSSNSSWNCARVRDLKMLWISNFPGPTQHSVAWPVATFSGFVFFCTLKTSLLFLPGLAKHTDGTSSV